MKIYSFSINILYFHLIWLFPFAIKDSLQWKPILGKISVEILRQVYENAYCCNRQQPSLEILDKVAECLHVDIKELIIDRSERDSLKLQ